MIRRETKKKVWRAAREKFFIKFNITGIFSQTHMVSQAKRKVMAMEKVVELEFFKRNVPPIN